MKKILGIYGAGGLGRDVSELARIINEQLQIWDKFVFLVDGAVQSVVNGIPVMTEDDAKQQYGDLLQVIIAVGEPSIREKLYQKIIDDRIELATLIHPSVHIPSGLKLGLGIIIFDYVTITTNVEIQDNACIQPHAVIGHDVKLGRHSVISSGCCISGNCKIGERTFIGFNSGIKEGVNIGQDVICSAGAIVFRDVEDGMIVVGNPARVAKRNENKKVFC